jgi:hypothetical protein
MEDTLPGAAWEQELQCYVTRRRSFVKQGAFMGKLGNAKREGMRADFLKGFSPATHEQAVATLRPVQSDAPAGAWLIVHLARRILPVFPGCIAPDFTHFHATQNG